MRKDKIDIFLQKVNQFPKTFFVYHTKIEHRLSLHSHTKHQITYVEGGVAYLKTSEKSYFLPARHFIFIPAGMEHFLELKTSVSIVRNIYIPLDVLYKNVFFSKMGIYPVTNLILEMILFTENWNENITVKEKFKHQFLQTLGNVIAEKSENPLPVILPTTTNERLSPILKYIHYNIDQPLLLNEVAKLFGFSGRSLSRLFRLTLDISFLQYVKLTRIIKSMEKLLQTEMSISQIAYASGYNSVATFSNTFFNIAKIRPVDFRKSNRKISMHESSISSDDTKTF